MNISNQTRKNTKYKLKSTKDDITEIEKSGIHKIKCNNCDGKYSGQSIRNYKHII